MYYNDIYIYIYTHTHTHTHIHTYIYTHTNYVREQVIVNDVSEKRKMSYIAVLVSGVAHCTLEFGCSYPVCFVSTMSSPARLSTKAPIQWIMGAQRPTREVDYLVFLLVAEVVSDWVLLLPPTLKAQMMVNIEHVVY